MKKHYGFVEEYESGDWEDFFAYMGWIKNNKHQNIIVVKIDDELYSFSTKDDFIELTSSASSRYYRYSAWYLKQVCFCVIDTNKYVDNIKYFTHNYDLVDEHVVNNCFKVEKSTNNTIRYVFNCDDGFKHVNNMYVYDKNYFVLLNHYIKEVFGI